MMSKTYGVYAAGNALVDITVSVSEEFLAQHALKKGTMTLISQEKQRELLSALSSSVRTQQSGGSAANTLVALSQLGLPGFYACKVGEDTLGHFYLDNLQEAGVFTSKSKSLCGGGRTGTCLVCVTPDAERTMCTFLGATQDVSQDILDLEALSHSEWLYMEGYLCMGERSAEALHVAYQWAQKKGLRTALSLSDPSVVEQSRAQILKLLSAKVDLLFCNAEEAKLLTQQSEEDRILEHLSAYADQFVVTQGKKGAWAYDGRERRHIAPHPATPIDTNGAGDMFAGVCLYGLAKSRHLFEAADMAAFAASKLVEIRGARLPHSTFQELKKSTIFPPLQT